MEEVSKNLTMAQHYLDIGQPERVLEVLSDLSKVDLENPEFWYLRGQALYDLEQYSEAIRAAQKGLGQTPFWTPLLYLLCNCEARLGNLAGAEQAILTALRFTPENPILLCRYAMLVAKAGQLEKAERLVSEATRLNPEEETVIRARIMLSHLQGNDQETVHGSRQLLTKDPEDIFGHYWLAYSMLNQGKVGRANRHFSTAASLNPADSAIVTTVREKKHLSHWLLWPLRPLYRLGPARVWIGAVVIMFSLLALGFAKAAGIFAWVYITFVIYSWVVPPLLRWWLGRRRI